MRRRVVVAFVGVIAVVAMLVRSDEVPEVDEPSDRSRRARDAAGRAVDAPPGIPPVGVDADRSLLVPLRVSRDTAPVPAQLVPGQIAASSVETYSQPVYAFARPVEPPDPVTHTPSLENPGGVNGDRPPR